MLRETLEKLLSGKDLNAPEIERVFATMLSGDLPASQIAGFLTAWRIRGEKKTELSAGARAMRRHAAKVDLPPSVRPLIDNCGTGGDGSNSFNISTAAALVAACAGARVAKHGNRSSSSQCGSADLLFEAGFPLDLSPTAAVQLLEKTGMTFFYAPNYHPMLKHVTPVRKSLAVRTIFNLLGPLANPIAPDYQIIGVGAHQYLMTVAEALAELGIKKALVVHSRDGLDELSPSAVTDAVLVEHGTTKAFEIDSAPLGVSASLADLAGGDPAHNFAILQRILAGQGEGITQAVCLNAAAVLWICGRTASLKEGYELATVQVSSGAAKNFFDRFISTAKSLAGK